MQVCRRLENVRSKPLPTLRRLNYIEPGRQTDSGEVEMKRLGAFVDYDNNDYYFDDPSIIGTLILFFIYMVLLVTCILQLKIHIC